MNIQNERKIEVNLWIAKIRWVFIMGLALVGLIVNSFSSFNYFFPWGLMLFLLALVSVINLTVYQIAKEIKRRNLLQYINYLSYSQVIFELIIIGMVWYLAGTFQSMIYLFFFLPIFSSSILISPKASIVVSIIVVIFLDLMFMTETQQVIPIINRHNVDTGNNFTYSVALNNIIDIDFFYFILGIFSAFYSSLLFKREKLLNEETEKLIKEKQQREKELVKLNETTNQIVKKDNDLSLLNAKLDRKINELKSSEKAMIAAFNDLKIERGKLEDEKNKTVSIINNFVDPIIVIDNENRIRLLNPAAKEILGFTDAAIGTEINSKNDYSMDNFKDITRAQYKVKNITEPGSREFEEEVEVQHGLTQAFIYKVITAPVLDEDNKKLGTMKIFNNLTREVMIDKMKSEFISIAAHQLRTPLSAIKWAIKMVLDGDLGQLNKEQQDLLLKGYDSNERIINLVNDMLNVSRIEEGRFGYKFKNDSLDDILKIVLESLDNQIREKNIKLIVNKPKRGTMIVMDKEKMILAIQNLLENAVKYTPEYGKIEVDISKKEKFLSIIIKDNGVGIPEKDQNKLFSKFFRAANVMRMQTEGSGLGLFIVKNVIEKHDGIIKVNSIEGQGTEIKILLPIKE